jgi:hypothetical protein
MAAKKTSTTASTRKRNTNRTPAPDSEEGVVVQCENFALQWNQPELSSNYIIDQPQFKFCKKRKEFFSNEYEQIWYKSPYKYNMRMKVTSAVPCLSADLVTTISISHEDGSIVKCKGDTITFTAPMSQKRRGSKKNESSSSSESSDSEEEVNNQNKPQTPTCHHEIKLGPFQFNVCSYKYDGKKFRLMIHLSTRSGQQVCSLTSPAFLIKAKKPIVKPGIKSKKRSHDDVSESTPKAKRARTTKNTTPVAAKVTTPEVVPVTVPPMSHFPNLTQLSPEKFDMQKKLVEDQLLQFGVMLNSLMNNAMQATGNFDQRQPQQLQYQYPMDQVMQPDQFVSNDHFMHALAQFMQPTPVQQQQLQHLEQPTLGSFNFIPQEYEQQPLVEQFMEQEPDVFNMGTEEFDLFVPVKSDEYDIAPLSPRQPMLTDDIFLL